MSSDRAICSIESMAAAWLSAASRAPSAPWIFSRTEKRSSSALAR
jgi:hypothetical protein